MNDNQRTNRLIVVEGVDGSGKSLQARRLQQSFIRCGEEALLTREPGGSAAAEDVRRLLVEGDPQKWDSMTELLLMYAARRAHCRDTIWPALEAGKWVISDRFADSSRAFQGIAGSLGLELVDRVHQIAIGDFEPALVLVLDLPEAIALQRAEQRGEGEDRFEKKGVNYQARVRAAYREIAAGKPRYVVIDANQGIDEVSAEIVDAVNRHHGLELRAATEA